KRPTHAGQRIHEHHDVGSIFDLALAAFDHDLGEVQMFFDRIVVAGGVDDAGDVAFHVGDFFGAFVDQEKDQLDVGVVGMDAARDVLQEDGLTGARRSDDQTALAETDGGEDVDHAGGEFGGVVFELEDRGGVQGGGIIQGNFTDPFIGRSA